MQGCFWLEVDSSDPGWHHFGGEEYDDGLNDDDIDENYEIEVDHLVGVEPGVALWLDVTAPVRA